MRTAARRWLGLLPWAALFAGLATIALLRTCENANEYDRYPEIAEKLLHGEIAFDGFHPFAYPLLVAAVMAVLRTAPLLSGCLVSAAAATVLVWATGRLAEGLRSGAGRPACLLAAANAVVWTLGATACSDMTAAALTTAAIALVAGNSATWSRRRLAGAGALLGAAVATRFSAGPIVVLIAAWTWWQRPQLAAAGALLAGAIAGYLPHGVLSTVATGSPFRQANLDLIYLKILYRDDVEQLQVAYDAGTVPALGPFLAEHGAELMAQCARDVGTAGERVLPGMMFGLVNAPGEAAWWPLLLALACLLALSRHRRLALLLGTGLVLHTVFVCLSKGASPRVLLPALPVLLAGLAVGLRALAERWRPGVLGLAAVLGVSIACGQTTLRQFYESEPVREVEVARSLPARLQRPIALFASYWLLDQRVDSPCWFLRTFDLGDTDATWQGLRERMRKCGADVLLVGRLSAPRIHERLAVGSPPDDFRIVQRDADVFVAELIHAPSAWLHSCAAQPSPARLGVTCEITIRLGLDADPAQIASVGVVLLNPAGEQQMLDFLPSPGGGYRRAFVPGAAGTWIVQSILLRRDGQVLRGPRVDLLVER